VFSLAGLQPRSRDGTPPVQYGTRCARPPPRGRRNGWRRRASVSVNGR
jgi:hypothetical protein